MDGQKADMVFTDPPYGMFLDADYSKMVNKQGVAIRQEA
jgi:DNA modification methylase